MDSAQGTHGSENTQRLVETRGDRQVSYQGVSYDNSENSDEIDLVELFGFVFRIRKYLALGLVLGAAVGGALAFLLPSPTYLSKVSVTLDSASLPAITDSKKVVESFAGALASPDLAIVALKHIWDGAPKLQQNFARRNVQLEELLAMQTLPSVAEKLVPLKLTSSSSATDFIIEVSLQEPGLKENENASVQASKLLLSAYNEAADEHNKRALIMNQESSKNQVRQATKAVEEAEGASGDVQVQREGELTRIRTELARLEFRLSKKAQSESSRFLLGYFAELKSDSPTQILTPAKDGQFQSIPYNNGQLSVERVVRLLSGLEEEGKLSEKDAEEIKQKVVNLQLSYVKNEHLYSSVISSNKAVLNLLYDSMAKAVVPVDRNVSFLPLFRLNDQLYSSSEASKTLEVRSQQKRSLYIVGSAILGLMLGGLVGGGRMFLRKNFAKLQKIALEGGDV